MTDIRTSVTRAFGYLSTQSIEIPADILYKSVSVLKANIGDIGTINAAYHDAITNALIGYFEGGSIVAARNAFKQAMIEAFGSMWDSGIAACGDGATADEEALAWFNARINQELSYIDALFAQARGLRSEEGFDYFSWVNERADGYTQTTASIYNSARMHTCGKAMVTWRYGDAVHCRTCESLNGKRHRASWFLRRDYIPGKPGAAMDCGGYRCKCGLFTDDGLPYTI